ncbi:unnamed protein product [Sympodiomycopsis kandeliae]
MALTASAGAVSNDLSRNAEAGPSNPRPRANNQRSRPPSPPGGGLAPLIQLRTKAPLPFFTCPHPIPPPSSTVGSTLKLSVLRLLTGEVTGRSSTAPMTESESLKLMTLHGWRMEMIALELRQNVLIAPETRENIGQGADDQMEGFELGDDAECALLEPDDEILIRIKPAFHLPDLHLPVLPSSHVYALPKGALTRAGTLSSPPPYSKVNIKKPAEPSSHSSSVQGQPNVNYNARHRDYTRGYRSITVQSSGQQVSPNQYFGPTPAEARKNRASSNPALAGPSKPLGLGMGVEPPAAQPTATAYRPPGLKTRKSSSHQKELLNNQAASTSTPVTNNTTETLASALTVSSPKANPSPPLPQLPQENNTSTTPTAPSTARSPLTSKPSAGERKASGTAAFDQQSTFGSGKPAGQDSMPLTALVIGPGVQGAVGRGSSSAVGHSGPGQAEGGTGANSEYGNAKAFASFTAAGGEVRHRSKPRTSSQTSNETTKQQRKDLKNHVRSRSQQDLLSMPEGQVLDSPELGSGSRIEVSPAQAAVEAAQRRAAASKAARQSESNDLSTSNDAPAAHSGAGPSNYAAASKEPTKIAARKEKEKVQLPPIPVLPPITNLAPFPTAPVESPKESDLPPMPTPAESPNVDRRVPAARRTVSTGGSSGNKGSTPRQQMQRTTSSAAQSRVSDAADDFPSNSRHISSSHGRSHDSGHKVASGSRPTNERQVSSSAQSEATSGSGGVKKKFTSRFAALAAPGLGLGVAPPLGLRRKTNDSSTEQPKAETVDDKGVSAGGAGGEDDDTWVHLSDAPLSPPLGTTPPAATGEATEPAAPPSTSEPPRKLTKAERRYADFQKQVAAEVSKQSAAEEQRTAERSARQKEEEKKLRKKEAAAKEKKEKEKWEIWEEVRKRTDGEKEKDKDKIM